MYFIGVNSGEDRSFNMLNQYKIEKATVEELQSQLKFLQRDIQHAESWLQELKHALIGSIARSTA